MFVIDLSNGMIGYEVILLVTDALYRKFVSQV